MSHPGHCVNAPRHGCIPSTAELATNEVSTLAAPLLTPSVKHPALPSLKNKILGLKVSCLAFHAQCKALQSFNSWGRGIASFVRYFSQNTFLIIGTGHCHKIQRNNYLFFVACKVEQSLFIFSINLHSPIFKKTLPLKSSLHS